MYRKLRVIHRYTALVSLPFLLVYAVSAMQFAHRKWLPLSERSTEETRHFTPGIADARVLSREFSGELTQVKASPEALRFRVVSLSHRYDVSYSISTGNATVKFTTVSFLAMLDQIHRSKGPWSFAAAFLSLSLLLMGLTGLYLWFKNHQERWIGAALLLAGGGLTLGLILSMRGG